MPVPLLDRDLGTPALVGYGQRSPAHPSHPSLPWLSSLPPCFRNGTTKSQRGAVTRSGSHSKSVGVVLSCLSEHRWGWVAVPFLGTLESPLLWMGMGTDPLTSFPSRL